MLRSGRWRANLNAHVSTRDAIPLHNATGCPLPSREVMHAAAIWLGNFSAASVFARAASLRARGPWRPNYRVVVHIPIS